MTDLAGHRCDELAKELGSGFKGQGLRARFENWFGRGWGRWRRIYIYGGGWSEILTGAGGVDGRAKIVDNVAPLLE